MILVIETAVKHKVIVSSHSRKLLCDFYFLFYFSTELSAHYSEEEFNTPVAQDPADLTKDTQVTTTKIAVTEAEDGDTELECASEKQ